MHNHEKALEFFKKGTVIPATPLAINEDKTLDYDTQRLLMRYYLDSGVGGIATAVHSTQFAIREYGLFESVINVVSEEIDKYEERTGKTIVKICGACGPIEQAIKEAAIAKNYGFDLVLLSPGGLNDKSEDYLIERTKAVSVILPVVGFYLQTACGGRTFSYNYWQEIANIEGVKGIKCASFNRYTTLDVVRAVCSSSRCNEITLYTGNDDNIVNDFISSFSFKDCDGNTITKRFEGGLLGHWCIWTKKAVELFNMVNEARKTGNYNPLLALGPIISDMNKAVFDPYNSFKGCVPGIHEVLKRQGLMKNTLCLDDTEKLSSGQSEEISRVIESYPELIDDEFINKNINKWKNQD